VLAVVDTQFPFLTSGFRYWENFEFFKIDKSTMFFSVRKTNDPFPAPVYPIENVKDYPITDIYCVFLNHTLGLLDYPSLVLGGCNYGLSKFIEDNDISVHTTIYPGGGYEESHMKQALDGLRFLRDHPNVKSVFTNLDHVKEVIPSAYRVGGLSNPGLYKYVPRVPSDKLHLLFAAYPRPEKGFDYLVRAFNSLNPSKYHLHIVGDWKSHLHKIRNNNYTYYGTLVPDQLSAVYYRCHVFINPAYRGQFSMTDRILQFLDREVPVRTRLLPKPKRFYITLDGFPTITASDAQSSGCCLISTNSRHDHFVLSPDEDYLEIREQSSKDLVQAIEFLHGNQDRMLEIAKNGQAKIRKYCDVKKVAAFKYAVINRKGSCINNPFMHG
jgi:glycosyltransferase involved in cell wall biosynthesis